MKLIQLILTGLVILFFSAAALAVSDVGLLGANKTLGYFIMPQTQVGADISSGLVYNQKGKQGEFEVIYTSYNSLYLLTRNMTQVSVNGKRELFGLGPLSVKGLLGLGIAYSPVLGGGLVADVGTIQSVKVADDLAIAVPAHLIIFNDGFMADLYANVDYRPFFMSGYELFVGLKLNARVVGALSQLESGGASGSVGTYFLLGVRTAI